MKALFLKLYVNNTQQLLTYKMPFSMLMNTAKSSTKTTINYAQVSNKSLQNLRNPLDAILTDKKLNNNNLTQH